MKKAIVILIVCGIFCALSAHASVYEFGIKKRIQEARGGAKEKIVQSGKALLDLDVKIDRLKASIDAHKGLLKTEKDRLLQSGLTVSDKAEINKNIKHLQDVIKELQNEMDKHESRFSLMLVDFNELVENK